MQSPDILKLGLTTEALGVLAAAMTDNMLRQLQAKSLAVADPSLAPAPVPDLQTVNMEAEAERKRKVEVENESTDESTDESSDEEERKEAEALNSREEGKPKSAKNRVNRLTKSERKLTGKGAAKGSASVQK